MGRFVLDHYGRPVLPKEGEKGEVDAHTFLLAEFYVERAGHIRKRARRILKKRGFGQAGLTPLPHGLDWIPSWKRPGDPRGCNWHCELWVTDDGNTANLLTRRQSRGLG